MRIQTIMCGLLFGLTAFALGSPAHAEDEEDCFDLALQPYLDNDGPLSCSCNPTETTLSTMGMMLKDGPVSVTGGRIGGGPINCYTTTIAAEAVSVPIPGGSSQVAPTFVELTFITRSCDTSGCWSILFGLFKGSGASCVIDSSKTSKMAPSWTTTGPCMPDPPRGDDDPAE